jgi:hypothetical protein
MLGRTRKKKHATVDGSHLARVVSVGLGFSTGDHVAFRPESKVSALHQCYFITPEF